MKTKLVLLIASAVMCLPGMASAQWLFLLDAAQIALSSKKLEQADAITFLILTRPQKDFIGDVRVVAGELGFEAGKPGSEGKKIGILLVKQLTSEIKVQSILTLQEDERTIEITTRANGRSVKSSNIAQQVVDTIKAGLTKRISSAATTIEPDVATTVAATATSALQ